MSQTYHKIKFKPKRGLQVQELSEIQDRGFFNTKYIGDSLYRQGSPIKDGQFRLESNLEIHIVHKDSIVINGNILTNRNILIGKTLSLVGKNHSIEIVNHELHSDGNNVIIYYKPLVGSLTTPDLAIVNNIYKTEDETLSFIIQNTTILPEFIRLRNDSVVAISEEGTFYSNGYFINEEEQRLTINKNGEIKSFHEFGFILISDSITSSQDSTLLDPDNNLADGADRLKMKLKLSFKPTSLEPVTFIKLGHITNQDVQLTNNVFSSDNLLNTQLSSRTFNTTGNFVLKPFSTILSNSSQEHEIDSLISIGSGYVNGNYIDKTTTSNIILTKSRETITESEFIDGSGSFFSFNSSSQNYPLLDFNINELIELLDENDVLVGTTRIMNISLDGADSKVVFKHVPELTTDILKSVRKIKNLSSLDEIIVDVLGSDAIFKLSPRNTKIYDLNKPIKDITSISFRSSRFEKLTGNGAVFSVYKPFYGSLLSSVQIIELYKNVSGVKTRVEPVDFIDNGDGTVTFTDNIPNIVTDEIYGYINYANLFNTSEYKLKTLKTNTQIDFPVDGSTNVEIILEHADIIKVKRIEVFNNQGGQRNIRLLHTNTNTLNNFNIDNGQRDLWYENGKITFDKDGIDYTDHFIDIEYEYYEHTNKSKAYFSFESYTNGTFESTNTEKVNIYKNIYTYTEENGIITYDIKNSLDFRPLLSDLVPSTNNRVPLGDSSSQISITMNSYKSQVASIILLSDGSFVVRYGDDINDISILETEMEVFRFTLPPFTFNLSDIDITNSVINNKGYSTKDIRSLEDRIIALENNI